MAAARDKALADLVLRGETAKTRVRGAASAAHAKLEQGLGRQQQTVREAGEAVAQSATQQATAQGERVQQGARSRAQHSRTIGEQWANKFSALEGGASTASDIRSKANDLAGKLESGASEGRQICIEHGQKIATDIRNDAQSVAIGMSEKLNEARARIDKDCDDALKSIDDGRKSAHDGITQSFEQTLQQVDGKKDEAGTAYDQLSAGAIAQVDSGLVQVLGKLDAVGLQMVTDVHRMTEDAKQYAIAPAVTAELEAGIGRTVAQHETRLGQLGVRGMSAFTGIERDARTAAIQQTSTLRGGLDRAVAGLQASLNGKVEQSAAKMDEVATAVVVSLQGLAAKAEGDLQQGAATGQREWNKQLAEKMSELGGRVDSILSQQDGQLSKLDNDLSNQYSEAKQKSEDAKRDKAWYESAWDSVTSAVSSAFEFVAGLVVGLFEAAWELLKGLWELLKTPLGWLLLGLTVILAVIVVVLVGWEALIIAGIVIGLCMAAYYVYLAVTTPGLSPYERGKLFGKAIFNAVLGFAGVELEGSNLLRFTQWGGTIPQAIRLMQEVGSLSKAIELVRLVGSIPTALRLVEALGSVERVMQLVQEVGSAGKLVELIELCGGVEELLKLATEAGGISELLALAKETGGMAELLKLAQEAGGIAELLKLAKETGGIAEFLKLAKETGGIAELLKLAKEAGGIAELLKLAKEAGGIAELLKLTKEIGGIAELLKLAKEAGGIAELLKLAKDVGGMGELAKLVKHFGGVQEILKAVKEFGGIAQFGKLLQEFGGSAKFLKLVQELGGATAFNKLLGMVGNDAARLGRLFTFFGEDAARLRRSIDLLQNMSDPGRILENLIQETGTMKRLEQLLDFAQDADHGFKISADSINEARQILEVESAGKIPAPFQRPPGRGMGDFLDAGGQQWDLKTPGSGSNFNLTNVFNKIAKELAKGENVVVNTRQMSSADVQQLIQEAVTRGWGNRVVIFP